MKKDWDEINKYVTLCKWDCVNQSGKCAELRKSIKENLVENYNKIFAQDLDQCCKIV